MDGPGGSVHISKLSAIPDKVLPNRGIFPPVPTPL